jgi:hypothetical protein
MGVRVPKGLHTGARPLTPSLKPLPWGEGAKTAGAANRHMHVREYIHERDQTADLVWPQQPAERDVAGAAAVRAYSRS